MSAAKTLGLVGRKAGMTRVFTDAGETVPVTVIEALPNRITQVRTVESDGYRAFQVAFGDRKPRVSSKPQTGHYAKAKVAPGQSLVEFRLHGEEGEDLQPGAELKVDLFTAGQIVDVTGTTIGKGFAGTMKRHNFARSAGLARRLACRTARRAPSVSARRRAACSRASACPATWATCAARSRTCSVVRGRCRAQPAAGQRRGAGRAGRPGDRASVGQGRRERAERKKIAPAKK